MIVDVRQDSQIILPAYAQISIAFEVREALDVLPETESHRRFRLVPRPVAPWVKDYDAIDGGPLTWPTRFDLRHWTFFTAWDDGRLVGGAAIVYRAPDIEMLEGRDDVALLWDLRVAPNARGVGVGRALMDAVDARARSHEASWLEVETQNINVPACRFYAANGFDLRAANRDAYPGVPHEIQLLWYKQLSR
jgi:GNAT superfamily N-acetyltransferase